MRLAVQLPRYGVVSAIALAIDMAIFLALTATGTDATLAAILGYGIGLIVHYRLSRRYVFSRAVLKSSPRLFGEFAASGVIGLVITAAIVAGLHDGLDIAPVLAKGVAVVVSFLAVYFLRRGYVFADGAEDRQSRSAAHPDGRRPSEP